MANNDNNHSFDDDDVGIFMKQESVYDPAPMTPTQPNRTLLTANDSPNGPLSYSLQMKRNASYGHLGSQTEAKVLVLYTGGTIGMLRNEKRGKQASIFNQLIDGHAMKSNCQYSHIHRHLRHNLLTKVY